MIGKHRALCTHKIGKKQEMKYGNKANSDILCLVYWSVQHNVNIQMKKSEMLKLSHQTNIVKVCLPFTAR